MKLLTAALLKKIPALYATEDLPPSKVKVYTKFFHPYSSYYWYPSEYDPEQKLFFGVVSNSNRPQDSELAYFSQTELESLKMKGLPIERDMYFTRTTLDKVLKAALAGKHL